MLGPVALAGFAAGALALRQPVPVLLPSDRLETPRDLDIHGLVDSRGHDFDPGALEGRFTLVFSGFTACPDICPTTLSILTTAVRAAAPTLGDQTPGIVLVTVDPGRDDPERLASYVAAFDPEPLGVTGARDDLERLLDSLGFISRGLAMSPDPSGRDAHAGHEPHPTMLPHSTTIALIGPDGRMHASLRAPHAPDTLAARIIAAIEP